MNKAVDPDYFPMRKGSLLLLGMLLLFLAFVFLVHHWYALQLAAIEQALQQPTP